MNRIGIDVGSKTIKLVVTDEQGSIIHSVYRRHDSNIRKTLVNVLGEYQEHYGDAEGIAAVTGSGGISVAQVLGLPFIQEVIATTLAVEQLIPQADTIVELGGEDAKIVYLDDPVEQRMNATCAGGTGSFIDSIADILGIYTGEMSMFASRSQHSYSIASRCAVFAQSDVLPLLNAGVAKEDIAASALDAVVKQTIGGLACGRSLSGNVVFLGGPLQYLSDLFKRFRSALNLSEEAAIRPPKAHLFTACGAALYAGTAIEGLQDKGGSQQYRTTLKALQILIQHSNLQEEGLKRLSALCKDEDEYDAFIERHSTQRMPRAKERQALGPLFVGIDAGAAAIKVVAINDDKELVAELYRPAQGNALTIAARALETLYELLPKHSSCYIARSAVTGSGDETIGHALRVDDSLVETAAHVRAACLFDAHTSFVLDAGGQDMKALWVDDGVISESALNDPCSSGLGAFIEETAGVLQSNASRFPELAFKSLKPVELDTKCTVFMNSRVRHAQKIGASQEDIAAGVAYSVARNAYTRLMSQGGHIPFGNTIVVQGGVFKSDAVLRCFEVVSGLEVKRPRESEYMGAIGAALAARERFHKQHSEKEIAEKGPFLSSLIGAEELTSFDPVYSTFACTGCETACVLSLVTLGDSSIFVSGNSCKKGEAVVKEAAKDLGEHDILGTSSMFPRSRGMLRARHHSEIGNGIVIPGYLRSFSGGMVGGGGNQGLSEEPRRVDYYANQLERDRTRERKIKIIPSTKYLSPEEVARKQQEEAKTAEQKKREDAEAEARAKAKDALSVVSSTRTLRENENGVPNVAAKERLLLSAFSDAEGQGKRAAITIGIPAALNAFEQLPFWHMLFLKLGFGVATSVGQTCKSYELQSSGSIPAESLCEPAKILHERIYELASKKVSALFVPRYSGRGDCPVSNEYADVVKGCIPFLKDGSVAMLSPEVPLLLSNVDFDNDACCSLLQSMKFMDAALMPDKAELAEAVSAAKDAQQSFYAELQAQNERALSWIREDDSRLGMLLSMRPYHCDEALLHGVDILLERLDCAVLVPAGMPESSYSQAELAAPYRFESLAQRVRYVADQARVGLLSVQSFNCGIDTVKSEWLQAFAAQHGVALASVEVDEMADSAHMDVYLRTFVQSMSAASTKPATPHFADAVKADATLPSRVSKTIVLEDGLLPQDLSLARKIASPDCCFTRALLLARCLREVQSDEAINEIHLPVMCRNCVTDYLSGELEHHCHRAIDVVWDKPVQGAADHAEQSVFRGESDSVKVGLVGNPLLCFDALVNEHIVEMIEGLGAQVVLPQLPLLQVDDVRYLEQLEDFKKQGVHTVLYLQNANCLKGHMGGRGSLHYFSEEYPYMPVTVLDIDPESSSLNRENRIRLAISAAQRTIRTQTVSGGFSCGD